MADPETASTTEIDHTQDAAAVVSTGNFHDVGRLFGATECWGLDAPMPSIHLWNADGVVTHAHLGDVIVRMHGVVSVVKPSEPEPGWVRVGRVVDPATLFLGRCPDAPIEAFCARSYACEVHDGHFHTGPGGRRFHCPGRRFET